MKKRALGMIVALVLLLQSISIPIVNADGIFFPGCEEVMSTKVKKTGWGTLGINDIKFNNNDQDSTDPVKSVFNKFKYYRGIEFWHKDQVCDKNGNLMKEEKRQDFRLTYNYWNNNYPNIEFEYGGQAQFIGIYNSNNNKRNFDVDFAANLDADLKNLVEKQDLQIMIMADTRNFDNGKDYETGIASIRFYGSGSPILKQVSTSEYEYRKGKTSNDTETAVNKSSGWHTFPKSCTRILAYLQSSGGNEKGKQNRAAVTNVRVYLKDGGKPNVTSVGLVNDGAWRNYTTGAGKKGQGKIIGDTVGYWVTLDEKVEVTGTPELQLDAGKGYTGLKAIYVSGSGTNTLYFDYKIQDMTNNDNNINTFGKAVKIVCPTGAAIKDIAGNLYSAGTDITSYFMNKTLTIDDTTTLIHKTNYEDTVNGTFYPRRIHYYGSDINNKGYPYAIGKMPKELEVPELTGGSGDQYNQPVMFGFINEECPIFRVVLNEEIQVSSLNTATTKLELQVYNKNKEAINGRSVTADLAGARIMNVNSTVANGINTGQTELLFRYKPRKEDFSGLFGEVFYLDFKGQFNEKNDFVFADDAILNGTNPLYNISGMKVVNSKLVLPPKNGTKRTPLNKMIGIDIKGPVLAESKIDTEFKKQLDDSSYLKFTDVGSGISKKGANISLCYHDNGNKRKAIIRYGNISGENLVLSCWNGKVSLSGISIEPNQTINYPLYLEYEIYDEAGNIAANKNKKDIEIKIDSTPPTVNGVKVNVDGNKAKADYDVSDKGVGKISPELYYKVENGTSGQVPMSNPLSRQSPEQEVEITGVQGSKNTYRIWANFSDTIGNWMESYFPSGPIDIATRVFSLSLDSAEGRVAKDHYVKIRGDKIPDKDFIIKLYYKWVPSGKSEAAVQQYDMIEYQLEDFLNEVKPFNLSSKEIQKKWMKAYTGQEALFSGEAKFIGYAEMWATRDGKPILKEAVQENISDTFYFDIAPPVINVDITGENNGYNSDYRVQFRISDGGGEYHNGIYEKSEHFDFKNNPPTYEIIIGSESLDPKPLNYLNGEFDIPFGYQFRNNEKYKDVTEAYIRFNATDRFGNKASEIFGPIKVDFQAPKITEFVPIYKSGMVEGKDYVKSGYTQSYDDVYIVRNLGDVLDSIKIAVTDNVLDGIYARYRQGVKLVEAHYPEESKSHTFTIDNLTYQSFDISSFRAMDSYAYGVDLLDMAGNSCSSSIRFIEDDNPPVITYAKRPEGERLTNANSIDIDVLYSCDAYETIDDLKFEIRGKATINTEKSSLGNLVLAATDNGDIKVEIRDRLGNFAQKTINVNCFDKVPPEARFVSKIGYPERPSKYGELVFEVSDDREIGNVSIAITKGVPTEDDYFNNELPNNADFPNGYLGVESDHSYASLGQLHDNLSTDNKEVRRYKLSYYALPSGEYDVYTRISDAAGNAIEVKIGTIYCSSEPVSVTDMEYSPSSATGGSVRVGIKTDSPSYIKELAYLSEDCKSSGNVGIMQAGVKKARDEGYSYIWGGELKEIKTFSDLYGRYSSINKKSPTNEDQYVYKYVYSEVYLDPYEYSKLYEDFLFDDKLVEPVGDMVDFMMNQALYSSRYEIGNWNEDDAPVINMSYDTGDPDVKMWRDIIEPLLVSGILMDPGGSIPSLQDATDLRLYLGRIESPTIDVLAYPQPFDNYVVHDGIFEKDENGDYINFEMAGENIINPFVDDGDPLTEEQVIAAFRAIKLMQGLRAKTINAVADKYVKVYAKLSDMGISMNHLLTFDYNAEKNYTLVDLSGQERVFNIKIDNIDPSIPHIPKEQIWLEDEDGNKILSYTNADSMKLVIDNENPINDIYKEYYIFDVEGGIVKGTQLDTYQGKPLYKRVEVTVNDNTEVSFKIINPTMLGVEGKTATGVQSYKITQFDRTPPTARLAYSPARKPGGYVNTDVTVSLTDIEDDKSTLTAITTNITQYTFAENGEFDFVITDEAGNKKKLTATVGYIDKTPVKLTAKFYKQNGEQIHAFSSIYNKDDETDTKSTYVYESVYLKDPIQAVFFDKDIEIKEFTINTDTIDTSYEYVGKSGNKGTLYIKGLKFDTSSPTASDVSYVYTKASAMGINESYITAKFTLSDNIVGTFDKAKHLVSVTGADEKGNAFTKDNVILNGNEVSVKFNYNGSTRLVFCDDANNLLRVDLKVESLDKTPPKAYIEYSKTTATNKGVTATIFLSEPADYKVMDINNTVVKDYSSSYSGYPINYVFNENKSLFFVFRDADGNLSKTYVLTITNIDKTPPELGYEILYKKALTTSEVPTLIDFPGAATIKFNVKSSGDKFTGGLEEGDTIFITNRGNSVYHTVMDNGTYSFMYSDLAGNVETILVPVTGIDKTVPTATVTGNPTAWINKPVDITITPSDKAGKAFVIMNGTRHDSHTFTVKQNSEYRFVIEDESNNSTMIEVKVDHVDTTPPTISYTGYKDIFVKVGEFVGDVKSDFEKVTLSDAGSGLLSDIPTIIYPAGFDPNKPGEYKVTFSATDIAGNTATFVRKIKVLGETDIILVINDTEVIPNSQVGFPQGELTLSVFNAEKTGLKIAYAFEPGFFNPAEMKGISYKKTMPSNGKATLNPQEPGLYTLLIQTEDRQTIVSYVFITGILNKGGGK